MKLFRSFAPGKRKIANSYFEIALKVKDFANNNIKNNKKMKATNEKLTFKVEQKTFRVINGKAVISAYDKQSRISKLQKIAKEKGFEVEYAF